MKTFTDWTAIAPADRGAAAAIGNFDGVHIGHQAVIDIARKAAAQTGAPLGVMTFEPHPREYFAPDAAPFRLMGPQTKAHRLRKLGVDHLYQIPFDRGLAGLSPEEFVRVVIAEGLGLSHVVIGADFRFGRKRSGTAEDLQAFGRQMGFAVTIAGMVARGDTRVSSTLIRTALSEGQPREAAMMLGHWHRIDGAVVHGDKRGKGLGYPTANMSIDRLHPPRFGVYAVRADVLTGPHAGSYDGAASIGVRPMFDGRTSNLETFLFDFDGDLYGQHLSVALVEYLRPELKFDSLSGLIDQMAKDCARARVILADLP